MVDGIKSRIRKIPSFSVSTQIEITGTAINNEVLFIAFSHNISEQQRNHSLFCRYKDALSDHDETSSFRYCSVRNENEFIRAVETSHAQILYIYGKSNSDGFLTEEAELTISYEQLSKAIIRYGHDVSCVLLLASNASSVSNSLAQEIDYVITTRQPCDNSTLFDFSMVFFSEYMVSKNTEESFYVARDSLSCNDYEALSFCLRVKKENNYEGMYNNPVVAVSNLPSSNGPFVGRTKYLNKIMDLWEKSDISNVVSIIAWGGAGKTSLVAKFRTLMAQKKFFGVKKVFDWTFSKQGLTNEYVNSADSFFDSAYCWFFNTGKGNSLAISTLEKAKRLLNAMRMEKSLLIIDGMETLFPYDDNDKNEGYIVDEAMDFFIRGLADFNLGLCIITSREKIKNISMYDESTCPIIELQPLGVDDVNELFIKNGVSSSDDTVRKIHQLYHGHALSLQIVTSYINDAFNGNADKYINSKDAKVAFSSNNKIKNLLLSYEAWYGNGLQMYVLRLLSIFDQAATVDELLFLKENASISGLVNSISSISNRKWLSWIRELKENGLVVESIQDKETLYDVHPIVRDYYREQLLTLFPDAFVEGNRLLFEYYFSHSPENPKTYEEFDIIFKAMTYGCRARLYEKVYSDVYLPRIKKNEPTYDQRSLGGQETNLEALCGFFKKRWDETVDVNLDIQHDLLVEVGFALRSYGEIEEAIPPSEKAVEIALLVKHYDLAAIAAGNLAELYLLYGDIDKALITADNAINYGKQSKYIWRHVWAPMVKKAAILCSQGRFKESMQLFIDAEDMQRKHDSTAPMLYGVLSYKKHDNILSIYEDQLLVEDILGINHSNLDEMLNKLKQMESNIITSFEHDRASSNTLHYGADMLALARTRFLYCILHDDINIDAVKKIIDQAKSALTRAARKEYSILASIEQIRLAIYIGDCSKADILINTTLASAKKKNMVIYETDLLIEKIKCLIINGSQNDAIELIITVARSCKKIGYFKHRVVMNQLINWALSVIKQCSPDDFESVWVLSDLLQ